VLQLLWEADRLCHRFFSNLYKKKINYSTVHRKRNNLPPNCGLKDLMMKKVIQCPMYKGTWSLYVGRTNERALYWPAFMSDQQQETSEINPAILWNLWSQYLMGYMDSSDQVSTSYGVSRRTWKWTLKLFFCITDLVIVKDLVIQRYYWGIMT
jgi:hypothetical protein